MLGGPSIEDDGVSGHDQGAAAKDGSVFSHDGVPVGDGGASRKGAEAWFVGHGLPWFIDREDARIARLLTVRRLWPLLVGLTVLSLMVGAIVFAVAVGVQDSPGSVAVGSALVAAIWAAGILVTGYALTALRGWGIAGWAARRALGDLGLLVPLVTRALPLLLLFTTFLFINTEVWQVASALKRSWLWATVLLFSVVAVGFLLGQLPEEVRKVVAQVKAGGPVDACRETPFEDAARDLGDRIAEVTLSSRQRVNLLLVLLIAQAVQVLLLAASVFGFFLTFGVVAIGPKIITTWTETAPAPLQLFNSIEIDGWVSNQLFQVSVFLAAFSGLYFTVYAVSDATYREQFFTRISRDLERAIGVRAVYESMPEDQEAS
jgi:hypothetical protein